MSVERESRAATTPTWQMRSQRPTTDTWLLARSVDGKRQTGACLAEIDGIPPASLEGTRVIVRREKAHPGTQLEVRDSTRAATSVSSRTKPATVATPRPIIGQMPGSRTTSKPSETQGLERFPYTPCARPTKPRFAYVLAARLLTC